MPYPTGNETLGTIPLAGQFFDRGGAVYNVMHPDFGARGDGVTDDTAAIQAVLDEQEGTVYLPPGTYRLTTGLRLRNRRQLRGAGDASVLLWDGGSGSALEVYADAAGVNALANVGLQDFRIDLNDTEDAIGIEWIYASVQSYIKNVSIADLGANSTGVRISKTWYADFDTISVRNDPSSVISGTTGFLIDGGVNQVNGVVFRNLQTNGLDIGLQIDSSESYHYGLTFVGGLFENGNVGVQHIAGSSGFGVRTASFMGTYFEQNATAEVDWQTSSGTPNDETGSVTWQGCNFFAGSIVNIDEGDHWFRGCEILSSLVLENGGNQSVYVDTTFPTVSGTYADNYFSRGSAHWTNAGTRFAGVGAPLAAAYSSRQIIASGTQPAATFLVPNTLVEDSFPEGIRVKVIATGSRNYDAPLAKITEGYLNYAPNGDTWAFETTYNKSAVEWSVVVNSLGGVDVTYNSGDTKYVVVTFIPL